MRFGIAAVLLVSVLASCAGHGAKVAGTTVTNVLSGSIAYRERMALPPSAEIAVWITDVTPGGVATAVLAETTLRADGKQVPIPFELRFDSSRVQPDHTYAAKAIIRLGGAALFESPEGTPVITHGNPKQVELLLRRAPPLRGTSWRLTELAGQPALAGVQATLAFPEDGRVAGSGSCNRFFGTVEVSGESITFGKLGSTMMACAPEISAQEAKYLQALQNALRFAVDASGLAIWIKGSAQPLRFARAEP